MSVKRKMLTSVLTLSLFTPIASSIGANYSSVQVSAATSKVSKNDALKVANYLFDNPDGIDLRKAGTSTKTFDKKIKVTNMNGFTRVHVRPENYYRLILDITKSGNKFHVHFHGKVGMGQYGTEKVVKWISANSKEAKDQLSLNLKEHITISESQLNK